MNIKSRKDHMAMLMMFPVVLIFFLLVGCMISSSKIIQKCTAPKFHKMESSPVSSTSIQYRTEFIRDPPKEIPLYPERYTTWWNFYIIKTRFACKTMCVWNKNGWQKSEKTVSVLSTDFQEDSIFFNFLESSRYDFERTATENRITEIKKMEN